VSTQRTIICGKGRLGQLIAAALQQQNACCEYARVDGVRGLVHDDKPMLGVVDTLIICFVPKHEENKSGWQGLLNGLQQQVQSQSLQINRVLFISSTAVYEAIEKGFVSAQTPVSGISIRSKGLLEAEKIVPQLSANSAIFRLTGLVGPGYNKYDPITYSNDKPRQAVDTRAVTREVAKWFLQPSSGHCIEVLTDGMIYWQGKKLDAEKEVEAIETLSKKFRLLKPSIVCI